VEDFMRSKPWIHGVVLMLAAMIALTGCDKGKRPSRGTAGPLGGGDGMSDMATLDHTGVDSASLGGISDRGMAGTKGWALGEFQPVFFDFDSAQVRPSELPKLEAVAQRLQQGGSLVIEGHADERGTAEYNRALGERRALSCRQELARLGVPASKITTISYGEERPLAFGHDETAWAQNRRCEFAIVK
jgi:peptidoglycan-associated lipoprotein